MTQPCSSDFNCELRAGKDIRLRGLWSWEDKSGIGPRGCHHSRGPVPTHLALPTWGKAGKVFFLPSDCTLRGSFPTNLSKDWWCS